MAPELDLFALVTNAALLLFELQNQQRSVRTNSFPFEEEHII